MRFEVTLTKLARHAIHKARVESTLGQMVKYSEEADSIRYCKNYFYPALSIALTEAQTSYLPNLPNDFKLAFSRTYELDDWTDLRDLWQLILANAPWARWKLKVHEDILFFPIFQWHTNIISS